MSIVIQLLSHVPLCDPMDCSTPGLSVRHHHPSFAQMHIHSISDSIQPSHSLTPSFPSALNLSQDQGFFQWVGSSYQMTKTLALQLQHQHQSFQWIFRVATDWFHLLAVQGTFRSLLQHHSLKASVLWCSAFFMAQLSQPYLTTGKAIALTIRPIVDSVMYLLLNTLSRFVIAFLPRSYGAKLNGLLSGNKRILSGFQAPGWHQGSLETASLPGHTVWWPLVHTWVPFGPVPCPVGMHLHPSLPLTFTAGSPCTGGRMWGGKGESKRERLVSSTHNTVLHSNPLKMVLSVDSE